MRAQRTPHLLSKALLNAGTVWLLPSVSAFGSTDTILDGTTKVEGHSRFLGKVSLEQPQGDVSMGVFTAQ